MQDYKTRKREEERGDRAERREQTGESRGHKMQFFIATGVRSSHLQCLEPSEELR